MTSVDILKVTDLEFQWTSEFKFYVETSVIVPWVEYAFGYQFPFYSVGNVIAFKYLHFKRRPKGSQMLFESFFLKNRLNQIRFENSNRLLISQE